MVSLCRGLPRGGGGAHEPLCNLYLAVVIFQGASQEGLDLEQEGWGRPSKLRGSSP